MKWPQHPLLKKHRLLDVLPHRKKALASISRDQTYNALILV